MDQAIPLPKSSDHIVYEQLGYIESYDAVVDKLYAMLVYKETKTSNDKWVVRIKASVTAGTVFDPDNRSLENGIRKALAHKEEYLVWGFNMVPKDDDPRLVENRLYFDSDGNITKIDLHLVTRDPDGNGLDEVTASIPWPAAEAAPSADSAADSAAPEGFKDFYLQYETACLNKDADFLKSILPSDIPDDEFAFVLDMSQASAKALKDSGVQPTFTQNGNRMDVEYDGDLGDGMTNMVLDFYKADDTWLKYDPQG